MSRHRRGGRCLGALRGLAGDVGEQLRAGLAAQQHLQPRQLRLQLLALQLLLRAQPLLRARPAYANLISMLKLPLHVKLAFAPSLEQQ